MKGVLGITGTPGTGKKSVAPLVARSLRLPCLSLNELAGSAGAVEGEDVDTDLLRRRLAAGRLGPAVVYGHLLPYVLGRAGAEKVAVLRCEPAVLKKRLQSRGYPAEKVLENVRAELIGLVAADALRAFGRGKTFEVDTTGSTPRDVAKAVTSVAAGGGEGAGRIDWVPGYGSAAKLRSLLPTA